MRNPSDVQAGPPVAPDAVPAGVQRVIDDFREGRWPPKRPARPGRYRRRAQPKAILLVTSADVRSKGLQVRSARQLAVAALEPLPALGSRLECCDAPRPCPRVGCKHHLGVDVHARTGALRQTWPELEPWEGPETCSLDVADRGPHTLEEVGAVMNLTRERVRQIEERALAKLQRLYARGLLLK